MKLDISVGDFVLYNSYRNNTLIISYMDIKLFWIYLGDNKKYTFHHIIGPEDGGVMDLDKNEKLRIVGVDEI